MKLNAGHYLLIVVLIITIIQVLFTPIIGDEAYYWMYSQNLDTGYFDHPPMVAWLIKTTNTLLAGTLGLRLGAVALSFCAFYLVWLLIPKHYKEQPNALFLYVLLLFAIPLCNVYSFIITPDAALLFFTAFAML